MVYPVLLPTTKPVSLHPYFDCISHPSLPLAASTRRTVLYRTLKNYNGLSPAARVAALPGVIAALEGYLPYIMTLTASLGSLSLLDKPNGGRPPVNCVLRSVPGFRWRSGLFERSVLQVRGKGKRKSMETYGLDEEVSFVLTTLALAHMLAARISLYPLQTRGDAPVTAEARLAAIQAASRGLMHAASITNSLGSVIPTETPSSRPFALPAIPAALTHLARAEVTLLAVLKDDPYPAIIAQQRNKNDKEWMFKAPTIPKVRTLLLARLCVAVSGHAEQALAGLEEAGANGAGKVDAGLKSYIKGVQMSHKAKACRFLAMDAEASGNVGTALAWLLLGLTEMGVDVKKEEPGRTGFAKLKNRIAEKKEDRKIEKEGDWGSDGGLIDERRVIDMLFGEWKRVNDKMSMQTIPRAAELVGSMPSGRDMYEVGKWEVPGLDATILEEAKVQVEGAPEEVVESESEESEEEGTGYRGSVY